MSTSYDPPAQMTSQAPSDGIDRLLNKMEKEMTSGREGGIPSDSIDGMMAQISKMSTDIVAGRKEILANADKAEKSEEKPVVEKKKESQK
mmetsp:Transcript_17006/g.26235  ORF Transcript_17006/g.26235 Transcript_17006/m.26235 type:complete len:90 (-) Transcript_17006:2188-2457(-)